MPFRVFQDRNRKQNLLTSCGESSHSSSASKSLPRSFSSPVFPRPHSEALEILKKPPLSEEESKQLFKQVAEKLEISEAELMKLHDMPQLNIKYRSQEWLYSLGIKFFTWIGVEKRIRK